MEKVKDAGAVIYADAIERELYLFFDRITPAGKDDDGDGRARIYKAIKDAPQNVFTAALRAAGRACFKKHDLLDVKYLGIDNRYDIGKVNALTDIYINICQLYDKECSIYGFSVFSGVEYETISKWISGARGVELTNGGNEIAKKLLKAQEESLSSMLISGGKRNPVGILGALNHRFAWNMPGVTRETIKRAALPADNLPRLCTPAADNMPALPAADSMPDDAPPQ